MITDTHTHIYLEEFREDRDETVQRALEAGVSMMILPNIDKSSVQAMKDCAASYPDNTRMMMGLHPSSVGPDYKEQLSFLKSELDKGNYIGVGEIGMDLYWDQTYKKEQEDAFRQQCLWAVEKNLPVSIHSRSSYNELVSVLKTLPEMPKGIFHCFGGSVSEAQEVITMGFYLGIGGVVSFKNSDLKNVLKHVDPKNLVVETDAPYLAPHPYRGKRNEPAYLSLIMEKLADIYECSVEKIESIIQGNIRQLFQI